MLYRPLSNVSPIRPLGEAAIGDREDSCAFK